MTDALTIAISKGRVFEESLPVLARAGIVPAIDPGSTRKLILDTSARDIEIMVIRSQDVPTFVEYGAADLGIVGKDVLMEHERTGLYEPLDLGVARCRLVVAAREGQPLVHGVRRRVATKYPNLTRRFYARKGVQVEIIRLYGSMELAPIAGLADLIVDVVDTGHTLAANGLVEVETITHVSSRLVVNKASMKMKHGTVTELLERLGAATRNEAEVCSP